MTTTTDPAELPTSLRVNAAQRLRPGDHNTSPMVLGDLDRAVSYATDRNRLWLTATAALTAAAKLSHPAGGRLDFAEFLADALAAVTANVGGVEELLAGRSGSWEADLVNQLVTGTLGYNPDTADLARRRTEPVTVALDVPGLVDMAAAPGNGPYVDELDELDRRFDATDDPAEQAALSMAAGNLCRDWADRYTAYADRFAEAVHAAAARLGVTVPVTVEVNTDPDYPYAEPGNTGEPGWAERRDPPTDLLAWQLWRAALDTHPISEVYPLHDHQGPLPVAPPLRPGPPAPLGA